jgi:colanic acid/amylovoran biosynthesis glycosyltransferase
LVKNNQEEFVVKVAFIVWQFPVLSETFILNIITGLLDRGNEVDIYAHLSGDTSKVHPAVEKYQLLDRTCYVPPIPKNLILRGLIGIRLAWENYKKNPLLVLRSLNVFRYGWRSLSLWLVYAMTPLLDKEPYDIIHCQFGTDGLTGMFLRDIGALEGKLITTFRGYDISTYVKNQGDRVYERLFRSGDFFLTNCEFFRRRIIEMGCNEKNVIVHYSGIDCTQFAFTPRHPFTDGKIRIATTGRLVEKKGIEYCIRALAKLAKVYPNLEYNIIGDGELKANFQQLIQELNLNHLVKLLGQKNQQEIIEILDNSHIFVAPSVTASDGNQDAPINVLKEAMAMGLPVVSTYHGGIPELVEDGISGFLVPERDVDALAEKLEYLIEHPEVWPQMGRAGRVYVEKHYDINKLNARLVEIYRQVLANGEYQPLESKPLVNSV